MRFLIVLILSCIASINCFPQQVEKGAIIKDRQFLIDKSEFTASDRIGNFISIRPHRINGTLRNYFVEFFVGLDFKDRMEIETEGETDILKVFLLNEIAYVFIKEERDKTISLQLNSVDLKSRVQSQTLLYKAEKSLDPAIYKSLKNDYNIHLDIDANLVLNFPVVEDNNTYVLVRTFSEDLKLQSEVTISPDDELSHKNINHLNTIHNNGKIYTLFQLNNSIEDNYYKLIESDGGKQRSVIIKIPTEGHELINSAISQDQMIISGLYSNSKKGGYIGFTYYKINLNTFEVLTAQQEFLNEKAARYFLGFFKGNRSIDIKDIFIDDQLNTYIVGQFYMIRKRTMPLGIPIASFSFAGVAGFITINPISTRYKVYDDMIIGKIDALGNLKWDNVLELRQTEKIKSKSNFRDSSTFTFFANNEINILMNGFIDDTKETLIVKQDKRPNKTNFYHITVNPHGGITPKILFSNANSETLFRAEQSVKSGHTIHILGQGNMRKQALKIEF